MKKDPDCIACPGVTYKHFKGPMYIVKAIALHTETTESLVIYTSTNKEQGNLTFARPRAMFEDGRFRRIGNNSRRLK